MFYVNIDGVDYPSNRLPPTSTNDKTIKRRERRKRAKEDMSNLGFDDFCNKYITLAPLPKAVPVNPWPFAKKPPKPDCNQEGNKPMRYNDNCAVASVTATPSDTATQRHYFLSRLETANNYRRDRKLAEFFNLHTNNIPKTYKELIDAIKNDKFKLDDKRVKQLEVIEVDEDSDFPYNCGPFDGIIWDGPQPDRAGYDKAVAEKGRLYTLAKDTIMSGDAAAMAKAVQEFDAWMPTAETTTVQ